MTMKKMTMKSLLLTASAMVAVSMTCVALTACGSDGDDNGTPGGEVPASKNKTFTVDGVQFTMVAVEGGTFKMGAQKTDGWADNFDADAHDDEAPVHSVTLSDYYIGETEVTQELWNAVMGSNPSYFTIGTACPVECVSWENCQNFITKLNQKTGMNFRLPTEAEWEFAARGGKKSKGYKFAGSNTIEEVAWDFSEKTHPVKTKKGNELGIYDMSGNVYEWCQDFKANYSAAAQTNPKGPSTGSWRIIRGGCYNGGVDLCRVTYRNSRKQDNYEKYLGLRLVL